MRYLQLLLFLGLTAILIVGCDDNPAIPTETESNKYPMALNNEWNYEITIYLEYGSGDKIDSTKENTANWTAKVTAVNQQVDTFSNVTFVEYSNTYDLDYRDTVYYVNTDNGLFLVKESGAIFTLSKKNTDMKENYNQQMLNLIIPFSNNTGFATQGNTDYTIEDAKILLQYPLEPGNSWYEYKPHSPEDTSWLPKRVVEEKINIETPAGNFSCFKVTRDFAYRASDYISLKFGLVKREVVTNSEHMPAEEWFNEICTVTLTSVKIN